MIALYPFYAVLFWLNEPRIVTIELQKLDAQSLSRGINAVRSATRASYHNNHVILRGPRYQMFDLEPSIKALDSEYSPVPVKTLVIALQHAEASVMSSVLNASVIRQYGVFTSSYGGTLIITAEQADVPNVLELIKRLDIPIHHEQSVESFQTLTSQNDLADLIRRVMDSRTA